MRNRRCNIEVDARLDDFKTSKALFNISSSSPSRRPPPSSSLESICLCTASANTGGSFFSLRKSTIPLISSSETKAPCARTKFEVPGGMNNISPLPIKASAPLPSKIVRLSIFDATLKAIRLGKFALITPVITFTDGLCVANIK